jgi:predicted glycosyltransferase
MSADLFLYVQHLLGIGHIRRAALIAQAASRAGLEVAFVSGGEPVERLELGSSRLIQLDPPLRSADVLFSRLETPEGRTLDPVTEERRRRQLLAAFERERPAVLLTEMFPFGRRQMRFELMPLVERAKAAPWQPAIAASVRDILTASRRPEKTAWILSTIERFYDLVLVHGDPQLVPFEATFPEATQLGAKLAYTGYVVAGAPAAAGEQNDSGEVLVSTGGGAVAEPLVEAACAARARSPLAEAPWRVLVGENLPDARFRRLQELAPAGMVVERSRPDFLTLLARCRLSISQAGYNTTLEVLAARRPAVVVPFAAGQESEQTLRARLLAEQGRLVLVEEAGLTPVGLARGIAQALALPPPPPVTLALDGAARSAELLGRLARTRPRR